MIKGNGFVLRSFRLSDKQSLARHANNKKISDNLRDRFPHPYAEEDAEWHINSILSKKGPLTDFAIEINDEAAGAISIFPDVDIYRLNAEIGYWLSEEHWGKGIMTAVINEVVKYTFGNLGIKRIYATPFTSNLGSIRSLEKAGFSQEAYIQKGVIKNAEVLDYYIYSINCF